MARSLGDAIAQLEDDIIEILRADCEAEPVGQPPSRVKLSIDYTPFRDVWVIGGELLVIFAGFSMFRKTWATSDEEVREVLRRWMEEDAQWMRGAAERIAELSGFDVVSSAVVESEDGYPAELVLVCEYKGGEGGPE